MTDTLIINEKTKLSESIIWNLQRNFFEKEGIHAWQGQVPHYITNNPYIANSYASVAIRYIQDRAKKNDYDASTPFYILEIGTGAGIFSFYFLKRFFELYQSLQLQALKVCYIMTDFTESNINFWREQDCFQPYLKAGQLDFARYDLENDRTIQLINSGTCLDRDSIKNPLIAFTNYIFDSTQQDLFRVEADCISAGHTILTTSPENMENGHPSQLSDVTLEFEHVEINEKNYYPNEKLNTLLSEYKNTLESASFLMPIGGFKCLDSLKHMSNNRFLLISSDKAYNCLNALEDRADPSLSFHGNAFSMMVNFHALGQYINQLGGQVFHQQMDYSLKTSVFLLDDNIESLVETRMAIELFTNYFAPGAYFNFHRYLRDNRTEINITTILSHLHFSHWDPHIFNLFIESITERIDQATEQQIDGLLLGIEKLKENLYLWPGCHNSFLNIGLLYQALDNHTEALNYYQLSETAFGKQPIVSFHSATCYYFLEQLEKSRTLFNELIPFASDMPEIHEWIEHLQ